MKHLIPLVCVINLISNTSFSLIAPFVPLEAERKGIPSILIGFIFSSFSISAMINSILVGKYMEHIGRRLLVVIGLLVLGLAFIGFGLVDFIEDTNTFMWLSITLRFIQGIGYSTIQTATYAILFSNYPERLTFIMGCLECAVGVGLSIGPVLGATLYGLGGYQLPFYVVGIAHCLIAPLLILILPKEVADSVRHNDDLRVPLLDDVDTNTSYQNILKEQGSPVCKRKIICENPECNSGDESNHFKALFMAEKEKISYSNLLSEKRLVFAAIAVTIDIICTTFIEPILSKRLLEFESSQVVISLFFFFPSITYAIFTPLLQFIPARIERKTIMMSGIFGLCFAVLMIGPSSIMYFPNTRILIGLGLLTLGLFSSSVLVPSMSEMSDSVSHKYNVTDPRLNDRLSGLFNFAFCGGQILAPILGSVLTTMLGYRLCCDTIAILTLCFGTVYFTTCKGIEGFSNIIHNKKELLV